MNRTAMRPIGAIVAGLGAILLVISIPNLLAPKRAAAATVTVNKPAVKYPTGPVYHFAQKVVYVEDHTGSAWPISTAVRNWDAGTDVSVRYGKCRTGAGCIRVYEVSACYTHKGCWAGLTDYAPARWYSSPSGPYMNGGYVRVSVNRNVIRSTTARMRQQVACHEVGHALGLGYHSPVLGSCMYAPNSARASVLPSAADRANLNRVY
jgi:hypothetical protein